MKSFLRTFVPFLLVAILASVALASAYAIKATPTAPNLPTAPTQYNPPIPQPEITRDFATARGILANGHPILLQFLWSDGMSVLDDYGYLNVERDDLDRSRDMVRVACVSHHTDAASGRDVWLCGPFYGRWVPENGTVEVSHESGYTRQFMITDEGVRLLFEYNAYVIY